MVDLDESYEYSQIQAVSYEDCKSAYDEISLYPNPVLTNTEINIEFPFWNESIAIDQVKVVITDLGGKKVKEMISSSFENGMAKLDITGLRSGGYFLHLLDEEGQEFWVGNVMIQE